MARKKALSGLAANPRRKQSWFALVEADNYVQVLGPACQKEIGIAYDDLQRVLGRLAAAIAAGSAIRRMSLVFPRCKEPPLKIQRFLPIPSAGRAS